MKKYKITHLISADFEATAIVNEDEIDDKTNDLKAYQKPNSKFNFTMLKGTETINRTYYEEHGTNTNDSSKKRVINRSD
tara:strand:+ start:1406 stop:1642 length:237 start_codon:yes stop_codon:yes gene_type:complete